LGILDIFRRKKDKGAELRTMIKDYYGNNLSYFTWNLASNIYNIPEVRNAIESFVSIFSTIPIWHKRINKDGNVEYYDNDNLKKILTLKPNPLQNATQFWNSVITDLLLYNNVFIEPVFNYENGYLKYLYILPNKSFQFDINGDDAYVQFYDGISAGAKYNLKDIIYLNRFSNVKGGERTNLGLYETVINSLGEQIVNVANPKKVRALLQGNSTGAGQIKEKDRVGTMEKVKTSFDDNIQGLAYLDKAWTVTPVNWQENDVNKELMQFVINIVYNYFGISDTIINNKATELEMSLFVKNRIKPIANQIENELTSKLFTDNEINFGNRIEFDTQALMVTTIQSLTNLANSASRQGYLNFDEIREYFGQPPIPDGLGKMYRTTGDTINLAKVDEYQAAQKGVQQQTVSPTDNNVDDINKNNSKEVKNE
jgi:HK97 family phage portal protein